MEVKINVQNVHLAEITETLGEITFGVPEHVAGAMEMSRTPQLSTGQLYGDGKITRKNSKKVAYQITVNLNKLPTKWRRYMEGVTVKEGVEYGTSKDEPKPFAIGWEVEKTGGHKELIWFLYCTAEPIQQTERQSEENTNYSTDNVTILALEHDSLGRYYTFIDTEDENVTEAMIKNFFKNVQTADAIADVTIDLAAIPGVVAPSTGAEPVTSIESEQYTGAITWSPEAETFAASTVYTATITLTPKTGYTLAGVPENFFTVAGATTTTNSAGSGIVTAIFPETAEEE